jgi:ankyrin repeat protein
MLFDGETLLHETVAARHPKMLDCLLSKTRMVNGINIMQKTPLHVAIETNNLYAIQRLLDWGADASLQDENGYTAAHYAAEKNDTHCLIILDSHKVHLDQVTREDFVGPFTIACTKGNLKSAQFILSRCG